MHGSVCLFHKYLDHLLEGENLEELDISSYGSSDNIFSGTKSLSSGWNGTCTLINQYDTIYNNYTSELTSLINIFSSEHSNLMSSNKYISAARPSGVTTSLMAKCDSEFADRTNVSTIGYKIYSDFVNKLQTNIGTLNMNLKNSIYNFYQNDVYKTSINDLYENLMKFDSTVIRQLLLLLML